VMINGTLWTAPSISESVNAGSLEIVGSSQDGSKTVGLVMPENVGPGTYSMDFSLGVYLGVYIPSPGLTLISDPSGTLTILANNTVTRRIQGNFQFTAVDLSGASQPSQLTQGFFSVGY
jgi:Family of unknown function (DUF6252)